MTDREIKRMLKNAYTLTETKEEKNFIRRYERRSLQLMDVIKTELRYIGLQSVCAGLALCAFFIMLARIEETDIRWTISSLVPICALIPFTLLSRSERFGMDELEAVSRFSLRFIRMIRMLIMGIFSVFMLSGISILLRTTYGGMFMENTILVVFPYLVSAYGAMIVTRKWHGRENIFGVLAVCLSGAGIPFIIRMLYTTGRLPYGRFVFLMTLLFYALIRECILYVKESEDLSWNLC